MSTPIPFAVTELPDGVVARTCKRKQAFSLNDPDNIEVARLATQAVKKKAKLSKLNSSEKKVTNQKSGLKSNRQPSIEEVEDVDNTRQHVFPRNPKNILESSDNDDDDEATQKATNLSMLGDAPRPPMFPPIFLCHLCIFLLIVASPRRSALAAPIPESDDHVT